MTEALKGGSSGVVVVTGAGVGLGRALAIEFARRKRRVVGFARTTAALEETRRAAGDLFVPMTVDVSDDAAVAACFAAIRRDVGDVSVLVNNAAVYPRRDFLMETPDSFMQTVGVNLGGFVSCTHHALADMTKTGVGRIVNVATFADVAPIACAGAYSVSKGAARILTRALVADLSDRFPGIVISDWVPGALATEMGVADGLDPAISARWGVALALWHDRSLNGVLFDRNLEMRARRSLKGRIKDLLLFQRQPKPRCLDEAVQPDT